MIISRTPYRISFFGGGTDYPAWYQAHGGAVLTTSIDKYCYLTCRYLPPFFEHRYQVVWSRIESCRTIEEIQHPAVRDILRYLSIDGGVEIHHGGDLPARSGMGSSSSFTVGLLHALYALKGHIPSNHQLATESIHIEQDRLKETVGSQDQVAVAYGGLNHIIFMPSGEIVVRPVTLPRDRIEELNSHLMLFYTGISRTASDIAQGYVREIEQKSEQLLTIRQMVDEGISILNSRQDIKGFGKLLDESWHIKRSLSHEVSTTDIEEIYDEAMSVGAIGGKILGAGGGGFLLLFVPPEGQRRVREKLSRLICVPFKFESSGSQIVFYEPEEDYAAAARDLILGDAETSKNQTEIPMASND